jgi:hypothetical protein
LNSFKELLSIISTLVLFFLPPLHTTPLIIKEIYFKFNDRKR